MEEHLEHLSVAGGADHQVHHLTPAIARSVESDNEDHTIPYRVKPIGCRVVHLRTDRPLDSRALTGSILHKM